MDNLKSDIEKEITSFFAEKNFEKSRRFIKEDYSNETLKNFLQRLGFPQKQYLTIHIAGTIGKGSTAFFLASFLQSRYKKVGIYTSPHVYSLNERFQINEKKITTNELFSLWETLKKHEEIKNLSYFDALTAMAFLWFAHNKINVAVIETGLGGRLDSTNVLEPIFTVLTPIALDHQNILGNSLKEIALEKAGIMQPDVPNYSFGQKKEVENIIEEYCKTHNIKNIVVDKNDTTGEYQKLLEKGDYLQANRFAVSKIIQDFYKEDINKNFFEDKNFLLPAGRLEWLSSDFLFDSAHNQAAIDVLVNWLLEHGRKNNWIVFMNFMKERNFSELTSSIKKLNDKMFCKFYLLETDIVQGNFYCMKDIETEKLSFNIKTFRFSKEAIFKKELAVFKNSFFNEIIIDKIYKSKLQEKQIKFLFFGTMRFYKFLRDSLGA